MLKVFWYEYLWIVYLLFSFFFKYFEFFFVFLVKFEFWFFLVEDFNFFLILIFFFEFAFFEFLDLFLVLRFLFFVKFMLKCLWEFEWDFWENVGGILVRILFMGLRLERNLVILLNRFWRFWRLELLERNSLVYFSVDFFVFINRLDLLDFFVDKFNGWFFEWFFWNEYGIDGLKYFGNLLE